MPKQCPRLVKYTGRISEEIEKYYMHGKKSLKAIANKYKVKEHQVQQLAIKVVYEIMEKDKLQRQIDAMNPRTNEGHGLDAVEN